MCGDALFTSGGSFVTTQEALEKSRAVKGTVALLGTEQKNHALCAAAQMLLRRSDDILLANERDVAAARGTVTEVMLDRLMLDRSRIAAMTHGIHEVAELPDPVGQVLARTERPNGLVIERTAVPMGVIAIIYESRPNVTSDAAALALKAGSACVLRSGKEAHRTASAIVAAIQEGLNSVGLPPEAVQLLEDTTRASANELMKARGLVDLLIPRGGAGLIRACVDNAEVPVLETGTGICHIYVDRDADQAMALSILENAKCSRPSVCNAAEVCLVHQDIAADFLPALYKRLVSDRMAAGLRPVQLRLDSAARSFIEGAAANDTDFDTEFLDYILAVRVVRSAERAMEHIAAHSTGHSEAIITEREDTAKLFLRGVDSAAVYWNASTRFTDGGEFGLGCEMGISTQKLHARGPLGLRELCTYKYMIRGSGQIR